MNRVAVLSETALFKGFPVEELEPLVRNATVRTFTRGSTIFHEGDPGNVLHVIVSGQVKIGHIARGGEEVVFAVLLPGDTFGELALFDEHALRTADAEAMEPTECLTLGREAFLSFLDSHPGAVRHLVSLFGTYIRNTNETFAEAAFLDIPGRVAKKLLDLSESQGEASAQGRRIRMRLTQRTLAGMVGASRENVNRALARLVAHGDIALEKGFITIIRPAELRKLA
jgi:CRP/FNR family transcriptional regulator/CRP/FNR family cyclic AMP-dependent transcriptional regulator